MLSEFYDFYRIFVHYQKTAFACLVDTNNLLISFALIDFLDGSKLSVLNGRANTNMANSLPKETISLSPADDTNLGRLDLKVTSYSQPQNCY